MLCAVLLLLCRSNVIISEARNQRNAASSMHMTSTDLDLTGKVAFVAGVADSSGYDI